MFFSFTGKTGLASKRNYCRHNPPGQFVSVPFVVLVSVVLVGFMHGWFALLSPKTRTVMMRPRRRCLSPLLVNDRNRFDLSNDPGTCCKVQVINRS